jgi:hypothetical protein
MLPGARFGDPMESTRSQLRSALVLAVLAMLAGECFPSLNFLNKFRNILP